MAERDMYAAGKLCAKYLVSHHVWDCQCQVILESSTHSVFYQVQVV